MCLSFMLFRMLDLSVFILLFIYGILFIIFEYLWCHFLFWLWIRVGCLSAHTHMHLHSISSIPELRPFRRKCWLRSREIVISTMASQTLLEFMVLMTSWGSNLHTIIRKCSHLNRTFSARSLWWVRIGVPYYPIRDVSEERFGHLLVDEKPEPCT